MSRVAALSLGTFVVTPTRDKGVDLLGMVLEGGIEGEEVGDLVTPGTACIVLLALVPELMPVR